MNGIDLWDIRAMLAAGRTLDAALAECEWYLAAITEIRTAGAGGRGLKDQARGVAKRQRTLRSAYNNYGWLFSEVYKLGLVTMVPTASAN